MKDCSFSSEFYENHELIKRGKGIPRDAAYQHTEEIWMNFYGLGKFETYAFLYRDCRDYDHFIEWVTALKGADFIKRANQDFQQWQENKYTDRPDEDYPKVLTEAQLRFWEENGYLRIPQVVEAEHCDKLKQRICRHLNLHMDYPETWYIAHPDWQGIMLQMYQNEVIEAVRYSPVIKQIFAELYQTNQLVAIPEKLGYHPPENEYWAPPQTKLHWDINIDKPVEFHIQGLIYLNEVPENRGPLKVVPGFHLRFEEWIKDFSSLDRAHEFLRITEKSVPVPGGKGDLILWRNTCPHAASANLSDLPRFVQYISYNKL